MTDPPHFELEEVITLTRVARVGMTVADVFEECVTHQVPGIPFCNERNEVIGRVSVRHTLKMTCIPEYMVKGAHLLGDMIEAIRIPDVLAKEVLQMPAEQFVLEPLAIVTSAAPVVKALAMMEQFNSSYAFVVDAGEYKGIVTRMWIASLMLKVRER
jgi:CBS domain-containing protein